MNYFRLFLSMIAVFIFVFGFDYLYHGILLIDIYNYTAWLWRSPEEMMEQFPYTIATQIGFSILISVLYAYYVPETTFGQGLRFGFAIGLLLGLMQAGSYAYMPISFLLAWLWFSGTFFMCLTIGAILSFTYKRQEETT